MANLRETPGVLLILVLSAGLVYLLVHQPAQDVSDHPPLSEGSHTPDITIRDLSLVQVHNDQIEWRVGGDSAELFDADHKIRITRPRVDIRAETGLGVRLEGDRGTIDTDSRDFVVMNESDDMKVELSNGYEVMTRQIKWSNRDRKIVSDSPVLIRGRRITVRGSGLEIDTDSKEVFVRGRVHGTIVGPT